MADKIEYVIQNEAQEKASAIEKFAAESERGIFVDNKGSNLDGVYKALPEVETYLISRVPNDEIFKGNNHKVYKEYVEARRKKESQALSVHRRCHTLEESGSERYYKLQKMNSIFDVSLMKDIDFITKRLASKKILTQEVVKTIEGKMFVKDSASWWRMLTYLPGKTFDAMPSPEHAREAGRLVGAFHTALIDCDYQFKFKLPHYHDVPHDMEKLRDALATGSNTPKYAKLKELAESILFHYEKLPQSIALPKRIVHDDLKITNILFADDGKAVALVDIDTFTYGALAVELGDALRSWSMPGGEDGENTHFHINLYRSAYSL